MNGVVMLRGLKAFAPAPAPMTAKAARLYPESAYLQAEWLRAVAVVRTTRMGWCLERRVLRKVPQ